VSYTLFNVAATILILSKTEQAAQADIYQAGLTINEDGTRTTTPEADKALDKLVRSNMRLAISIARKHQRNSIDLEDLTAEAMTGIVRAAETFDASKGASFTSYSAQWIRANVQAFVQENCGTIRIGTRTGKKLFSSLPRLRRQFGDTLTPELIARELGLDADDVTATLPLLGARAASLNAPLSQDGGCFGDLIEDDTLTPESRLDRTRTSEAIVLSLSTFADSLDARDLDIFQGRVINEVTGSDVVPAADIAETHGVTKQRVSQLESRLKKNLRAHFVREFGDAIPDMLAG
jgi:RNA polymerase sigma factor (sigma-70 family)